MLRVGIVGPTAGQQLDDLSQYMRSGREVVNGVLDSIIMYNILFIGLFL